MINLLRTIRRSLIEENRLAKYGIYALGEIILVVIGILIALQINTRNEYKRTLEQAETFISDIRQDLRDDTSTFNAAIRRLGHTFMKNESLLDRQFVQENTLDSLITMLETSYHSTRIYHINNSTYLKMSNTGFLYPAVFNDIFTEINSYYNKEQVTYLEHIEWDEEQTIDHTHPEFLGSYSKGIDLSELSLNSSDGNLLREFLSSVEFRNRTWRNLQRKRTVRDRIKHQKTLTVELIKKIDEVLGEGT